MRSLLRVLGLLAYAVAALVVASLMVTSAMWFAERTDSAVAGASILLFETALLAALAYALAAPKGHR